MSGFIDAAKKAKDTKDKPKGGKRPGHDLGPDEIKQCKLFFKTFDRDSSQSLNRWELRLALEAMGQNPTDADIDCIMADIDTSKNGKVEFAEFLKALQLNKKIEKKPNSEQDLIDAYVAMGGKADKSGLINAEQLSKVIKDDFGLTIRIEELMEEQDFNNEGFVNFEEFKQLLG